MFTKNLINLCSLSVLSILFAFPAIAQDSKSLYLKVDYFQPAPGATSEYLTVERELWKPLHQERMDRGIIRSWNLYQVVAGEPNVPYTYVTINVFDDFGMIDYFDLEDIMRSIYPGENPADLLDRTGMSRDVVRTEIWRVDDRALENGRQDVSGDYLSVNFFDFRGMSGEARMLGSTHWKPIHEILIEDGAMASWMMNTLLYPSGDVRNYTYKTIDYYHDLGDMIAPTDYDQVREAHPGLSDEDIINIENRSERARTMYKQEVWRRVDTVD